VAVAVAVVVGFAAAAFAQGDASPNAKPVRTITVGSTASVEAQPDEAVIDLGVRSESAESVAAFAQNAKAMQMVLDAVGAAGVAEKDVQTTNVSLEQRVTDRGEPSEQRVFVASNSIRVTIRDLTSVGRVIDAAVRAGVDSVNDIRFQVADPEAVRSDALTRAVTGARAKADALARAAGADVIRVVTIDERSYRPPVYRAAIPAPALAVDVATPVVPPESLDVMVTISVIWEIA
jgi:uncharacterized protein YggE